MKCICFINPNFSSRPSLHRDKDSSMVLVVNDWSIESSYPDRLGNNPFIPMDCDEYVHDILVKAIFSQVNLFRFLGEEIVAPDLSTRGMVDMIRSENMGFSGANLEAFSPVNTSVMDWPFRTSRLSWSTFRPKGCISLRQLVCMKTLEILLPYLFKTLRSSWAEVPSKSPINFRCRFSPFL